MAEPTRQFEALSKVLKAKTAIMGYIFAIAPVCPARHAVDEELRGH